MNKVEFEQKFLQILTNKINIRGNWINAIKDLLHFIDEHKIYEYKSYESILFTLKDLKIFTNAQNYLEDQGAGGIYERNLKTIMLKEKHYKRQNYAETFIHELVHALSSEIKVDYKNECYPKLKSSKLFPEIPINEKDLEDETDADEIVNLYQERLYEWIQNNSGLFLDAKPVRPTKFVHYLGFMKDEIEFENFITPRKLRSEIKNIDQYIEMNEYNKIGENYVNFQTIEHGDLIGIVEGVTEFIAQQVKSRSSDQKYSFVAKYTSQTMLASQLYLIFGENLYKDFFVHGLKNMSDYLQIDCSRLQSILTKISKIDSYASLDIEREKNMEILGNVQIDLLHLFERKILRELAKYKDYFDSPQSMRMAIVSAFFDYSKNLYFGIYKEELVNPGIDKVWEEFEKSLKNCENFGNKLLQRRQMPSMSKLRDNIITSAKNQNYLTYGYISPNLKEITLKDRIAINGKIKYDIVDEKRRKKEIKKLYDSDLLPGQLSYNIANGEDQVELYCNFEDQL